jgi:YfiH family protein
MFYSTGDGIYRCSLLDEPGCFEHGFGARRSTPWRPEPLATLRQIHSDHWVLADGRPGCLGQGDALISDRPGLFLGVRTADCVPILIADPVRKAVAAVHAGWRGAARAIAARTVNALQECFGSRPEDLVVAMGPAICSSCYVVGPEVAQLFPPSSPAVIRQGDAFRLDLREICRRQLDQAGVRPDRIAVSDLCTKCLPEEFFSYRRGDRGGRMLSFIGRRI